MPLGPLSEIPKEVWLALGAFAGAAATIVVGWFNLRKSGTVALATERAELSAGQREMISLLRSEVDALHAHMADMDLALKAEKESCEERLRQMDSKYTAQMNDLRERMRKEEQRDA